MREADLTKSSLEQEAQALAQLEDQTERIRGVTGFDWMICTPLNANQQLAILRI
jgi:hypothetical protein